MKVACWRIVSSRLGAGSRIRIRGANSVSQQNDPLIVVDGARVDGAAGSYSLYVGGQEPSRINDLNPDEIASIEIVKGPSAAALEVEIGPPQDLLLGERRETQRVSHRTLLGE